MSLGYARAQRDQSCYYAVGFYDRNPEDDKPRNVTLRVKLPGLRAISPSAYLFRSPEARLESTLTAAFMAPEIYETGYVRSHLFLLQPGGPGLWEALLAVSFPVEFENEEGIEERDLGAMVFRNAEVAHSFNRRMTLKPRGDRPVKARRFTFLEPLSLSPGAHQVSVVVADSHWDEPRTAKLQVEIPEVPRRELMLVEPVMGRPAGANIVVRGANDLMHSPSAMPAAFDLIGSRDAFDPLLVQRIVEGEPFLMRNKVCIVASKKPFQDATVERTLSGVGTPPSIPAASLELERDGHDKVRCQALFDSFSSDELELGRYAFTADVDGGRKAEPLSEELRFVVQPEARKTE